MQLDQINKFDFGIDMDQIPDKDEQTNQKISRRPKKGEPLQRYELSVPLSLIIPVHSFQALSIIFLATRGPESPPQTLRIHIFLWLLATIKH